MTRQNTQTFHKGWTRRLRRAIHENNLAVIQESLERNADPDGQMSEGGMTFLDHAAKCQQVHAVAMLIEFGAVADDERLRQMAKIARADGLLTLHTAVELGLDRLLTRLLQARVDVDTPTLGLGWSPLMFAAHRGSTNAVGLLLAAGADGDRQIEASGDCAESVLRSLKSVASPLSIACAMGHEGVVRLLLNAGANIDVPVVKSKGSVVQTLFQSVHRGANKEIESILDRHKAKTTETVLSQVLPLAGTTRRARL